jgi:hypothetical protein
MSVITCRSNLLRGARQLSRKRPTEAFYHYVGGTVGTWEVTQFTTRQGEPLAPVPRIDIINGQLGRPAISTSWILSGLVRNTRYVSREEFPLPGRVGSREPTCAALIPIRRSMEWWQLGHQVRREIQQTPSVFGARGLLTLSAMIHRWQHRRDLSEQFDGVTWFEYEARDSAAFDDLLADWRASEEWKFVDRECDIRLVRTGS